jgi:putative FmdB family regulatory protein
MPIFEYRCEDCGNKFEAILFGEQQPECPKCHTQNLQKQLSTFSVAAKSGRTATSSCGAENCCMGTGSCSMN